MPELLLSMFAALLPFTIINVASLLQLFSSFPIGYTTGTGFKAAFEPCYKPNIETPILHRNSH